MKRLGSLAGWAAALAVALCAAGAQAQRPDQLARIGFLSPAAPAAVAHLFEAFRRGMCDLGRCDGRTIAIESQYADGHFDRLPALAQELARREVRVMVTSSVPGIRAAANATRSIPIVFAAVGEPMASGHVASLSRPGGNVTGLSILATELGAKRLQILKEASPGVGLVAIVHNPSDAGMAMRVRDVREAARALGLASRDVEIRSLADFDAALAGMEAARPDAMLVVVDPLTLTHRQRIIEFAAGHRIPSMYESREFVDSAGLISYGASIAESYRRAATYVDRILKGAKPGELPVEQPTKFELVVNLKTARALGIAVPQSILLRADEVIE